MKLDLIDHTARALNLGQFFIPRNKGDAAYISTGQAFAQQALPLKKDFNGTLKQAMVDLKRFDVLVKNTVGNNAGVIAAWKLARRIGHTPAAKTATAGGATTKTTTSPA